MLPIIQQLTQQIQGEVLADSYSLGMYSTDASVYQIRPLVVVLPKDESDVLTALKLAGKFGMTVLARGGGTSLAGQTVGESMILDFSKYMHNILEFNPEERWIRVQPGKVRDELNAFLQPYGLHFAPDPATSSRANVGGMVGNNSSGTKSILYGKTVDHVLAAKVALADGSILHLEQLSPQDYEVKSVQRDREGTIYRRFQEIIEENREEIELKFPKVMRRVGGYNLDEFTHTPNWNLSKLITGSEGTLAVTLELTLNLEPLPAYKSVCVVHFSELNEAIRAVTPMLDFRPAAIEILDETVVQLSRQNLTTQRSCHFIEGNPAAILIVEFYGDSQADVLDRPTQMVEKLKSLEMGYAYPIYQEGPAYEDVWIIRKKGLGLMLGIKGNKKPLAFIEDAGIPTDVLPEYIERVLQVCKKNETEAAMYAHASVGVIHVRPILDLRQAIDIKRFKAIAEQTFELVQEYGGSWSGEHGDGLVRSWFNERFFGAQLYQAFKQVKQLFDPENRMNPGKIVDSPPIDQHLRYGESYQDQPVNTLFHYRKDGSFGTAVHMCTGVGECRKVLGGTMCPSFKATRQEEHSTRGRANALRLAMSGQLEEGLHSDRLQEVMDLCLSCKACKSECPSNVDMAKLKSEVRQQYLDTHGLNMRDRLIQRSSSMAKRLSGRLAPLINALQKTQLFRQTLERIAGFDKDRVLPSYAPASFAQWYKQTYQAPQQSIGTVALFADTYLNYHEPEIGKAAIRLLSDCGYTVELAEVGCCQRPRISHGLLRQAKTDGSQMAKALDQYLQQGIPVLVCEPSCASALVDDLPDLIEDESLADRMSKGVYSLDLFLAQKQATGKLRLEWHSDASRILVHGHCHQKAIFGTKSMNSILSQASQVEEIPSGCCGMAGSFGYEKEHINLSEKIGEQILFPAIRQAKDAEIVACGFSCRHQIDHFTNRKAKHWVELVRVKRKGEMTDDR